MRKTENSLPWLQQILWKGGVGETNPAYGSMASVVNRASNVSHTVVLRPLKAGYFNFTSATITYLAQEGAQVVVSG
ncbi:hypothetical protein IHE44_0010594 [Lamprotornis superbus]|uniref:Uncharacterized protein n=1 Tax=Lamprotornis superbus TaxID=245042 RepID=A0A835NHU6_9PASS|nr:hypothetical protein IHE44_0010594 [Lamprotornis superbus]